MREQEMAIYMALEKDDRYFNDVQLKCYIEYTDKIIDENPKTSRSAWR